MRFSQSGRNGSLTCLGEGIIISSKYILSTSHFNHFPLALLLFSVSVHVHLLRQTFNNIIRVRYGFRYNT